MASRSRVFLLLAVLAVARPALGAEQAPAANADQCVACHTTVGEARLAAPVKAFEADVHRTRGFTCADCHGGDAAPADRAAAHDARRGFRGALVGGAVIESCARCHSDAELMRRFAPRQRVDQASEYAASVHGQRLATGDLRVATCTSCHQAHGIRQVSDARSPVFPTNVAATCARCHADPEHMKGYAERGSPLPTTQRADYERSVHYRALVKQNDLSAPTCNDCHGNHGAAPPGIGAVTNVCGTCHAVFQAKYETSVHKEIFERGCVECHGNHAVEPASDRMLGAAKEAVCVTCHSEGDNGLKAATAMRAALEHLKGDLGRSSDLIARVRNDGMEVSDQELALGEARNRLTLARTEVHTTNPALVDVVVRDGLKIVSGVERDGQTALAELKFRRRGLFASLGAILLLVVALGFKIRDVDRRHPPR